MGDDPPRHPARVVRATMNHPEQRLVDGSQQGRWIYQSRFPFDDERIYLVRVVVDEGEQPGGGRKPRTGPARSTNIGASNEGGIRSRGGRRHCPASPATSAGKGMTRRPRGCWHNPPLSNVNPNYWQMVGSRRTMQTMNISFPDRLKEFVDHRVGRGRCSTVSEYSGRRKTLSPGKLEALLAEGFRAAGQLR
jgi:hypothetical protein